ncbi:MAG: hypothetical protein LBC53_02360 [Spirochaetaceae bacterium]|jgi:hypothetical protein|nr:hypothetical protein [Spirochaetaceae bacterium]
MNKAFIFFLAAALTGGAAWAQEDAPAGERAAGKGFKVSGELKTGVNFRVTDEKTADGLTHDPSIRLWHDDAVDAGAVRFDLSGEYAGDNYGAKLRLRAHAIDANLLGDAGDKKGWEAINQALSIQQAYLWGDFFGGAVRAVIGSIDDSAWGAEGDEGFSFDSNSKGGLRLEVKAIKGLNFGVFFNAVNDDPNAAYDLSEDNKSKSIDDFVFASQFLKETAFGAKYEGDFFNASLGFRLDSNADQLSVLQRHGRASKDVEFSGPLWADDDEYDAAAKGAGFYIGAKLKAVPNFIAVVEARIANLGGYEDYGWAWINETVGCDIGGLKLSLVMHQFLWSEKNIPAAKHDDPEKAVPAEFTFKPGAFYALTGEFGVGLEAPVDLWGGVLTQFRVKPKAVYALNANASIEVWYEYTLLKHGEWETGKSKTNNIHNVQINFDWAF